MFIERSDHGLLIQIQNIHCLVLFLFCAHRQYRPI